MEVAGRRYSYRMKKNKKLFIALALVAALVLGFNALNSFIYNEKQGDAPQVTGVSGIVVCLPHKAGAPQSKECMMGLMTPNRTHYALDLSRVTLPEGALQIADRISANGTIMPPAADEKYDIAGTFTVTDSLVIE